jgi:hypothetical protein
MESCFESEAPGYPILLHATLAGYEQLGQQRLAIQEFLVEFTLVSFSRWASHSHIVGEGLPDLVCR